MNLQVPMVATYSMYADVGGRYNEEKSFEGLISALPLRLSRILMPKCELDHEFVREVISD